MALLGSIAANSDFSQLSGTVTNDNASAGNIGEFISSFLDVGSAPSLSNGVTTNLTSISLTAGDWDVRGQVVLKYAAATQSADGKAGVSINGSASLPTDGSEAYDNSRLTTTTCNKSIPLPPKRASIASTQTMYLVAQANFSAGTCNGFGFISARRVR